MSREKLKAERIGYVQEIHLATDTNLRDLCQKERDELTLESLGRFVSLFKGTIIKNFKDINSEKSLYVSDEGPFVAYLRDRFKLKFVNKNENVAISPACYRNVPNQNSVTGAANVLFANGLWLDLDTTDLTPEDLAKIFTNLRFVAYSTFSHTDEKRRYRAWFPTSDIMTNKQYRNIIQQIVYKIEDTGVYIARADPAQPNKKVHGIERKWDASSKFYLPCKPSDGSRGFFKVFNEEGREPLDVDHWLENSSIPLEDTQPPNPILLPDDVITDELTPLQVQIAEAALDKFKSATEGCGHVMYYKLHRRLLHNGIRGAHWQVTMSQAASGARSPHKRRKEMEIYRREAW